MAKIGLVDVDSHNYPNLALMKISAYHKSIGDNVEFVNFLKKYDKVYVSKVFSSEYTYDELTLIQCDDIVYGGTGYAISIDENGKEFYDKEKDKPLPLEIERMYPDYSLYPMLTKDTAYGFLTRGCPNNCSFCIVSKKESICSHKVADLSNFWKSQKNIILNDPNILACKDKFELLQQLIDSKAYVDFNQGLDARFINEEVMQYINQINIKNLHFAFDFMKFEKQVIKGLQCFTKNTKISKSQVERIKVYMLVNYDTSIEEDLYRIRKLKEIGLSPYVMIYRKPSSDKIYKDMQRWANNVFIQRSCDLLDYVPRKDGLSFKEIYLKKIDAKGVQSLFTI